MRRRENVHFQWIRLKMAVFPMSRGKNRMSQGVENRGSQISMPLALRVYIGTLQNWRSSIWSFCIELHRDLPSPIHILEGVNLHFGG